ncbi:MAG: T9SS type A sorting domain-containing protein, partial [Bacteroidota bacterium]
LVWGLSYTGEVTAELGQNALEIALADGCFDLSEGFVTVTRTGVDGGTVATVDGESEVAVCAGDGEDDVIMFMHETSEEGANFAYVVTDEEGIILGLPPGNEVNFEGAGEGICLVWGLSYTGSILAELGQNALEIALADGCFDLSEGFVTVNRTGVDGGMVMTVDSLTEVRTCVGDGEADVVMFAHTTSAPAEFRYVVTDTLGTILGLPPGNEVDFEGAGVGVCLVWGLSFSGELTAELGDNALEIPLSDGCFDLSEGFVTVTRDTICEVSSSGIFEIPSTKEIVTYPNPATSNVLVRLPDGFKGDYFLDVMDLQGKVLLKQAEMMKKGDPYIQLDVQSLEKGIYLIHLVTPDSEMTTKFIKN